MKLIIDIDDKDVLFDIKNQSYEDIENETEQIIVDALYNSKPLQAELEEIKAEIDNIRDVEVTDGNIYVNEDNVFEILDNHINKADCDNDCEHCTWTECPKE